MANYCFRQVLHFIEIFCISFTERHVLLLASGSAFVPFQVIIVTLILDKLLVRDSYTIVIGGADSMRKRKEINKEA